MKAWQRERQRILNSEPVYLADDNEVFWQEENDGPEKDQDFHTRLWWHSSVPGSSAQESICNAAVQATENKGLIVENGEELLEKGYQAIETNNIIEAHKYAYEIFDACYNAKKDETSSYYNQTFYESFDDIKKVISFPKVYKINLDDLEYRQHSAWLAQIIGGAYGTCLEGYTGHNIKKKYGGEVSRFVRKPNTYNDDITYELVLLLAYKEHGKETSAKDIAECWLTRIPTGWSAEEWALRNLKVGIMPPESGRFHNPFNEWIGAQMRGAICGQLYPGNLEMAAKAAFEDASISHARNGILGEVFNAMMVSLAFVESDTKKIVETVISLIPEDSEYGGVIRFALDSCIRHKDYDSAWMECEEKYSHYNWIHSYPNACAEIIALYFGEGDFIKTLSICGGCGQDVDCNAAQVMTIVGIINGLDKIPDYYKEPIGDKLITYVRGLKELSIKELAKETANVAKSLMQTAN